MSIKEKAFVSIWKKLPLLFILGLVICVFPDLAFAADKTPKIMSGTTALAKDALKWVLILLPVVAAFALGWCKVQAIVSGNDPSVVAKTNSWMKNIIIGAIIGETAGALITSIVAYYS